LLNYDFWFKLAHKQQLEKNYIKTIN